MTTHAEAPVPCRGLSTTAFHENSAQRRTNTNSTGAWSPGRFASIKADRFWTGWSYKLTRASSAEVGFDGPSWKGHHHPLQVLSSLSVSLDFCDISKVNSFAQTAVLKTCIKPFCGRDVQTMVSREVFFSRTREKTAFLWAAVSTGCQASENRLY